MIKTDISRLSRLGLLVGLAALLSTNAPRLRAQDAPDTDLSVDSDSNAADAPNRVARISFLDGSVSFQPADGSDWGAAVRNRPVTIGDKIWVDKDARAELQAGMASIHIASMTSLSFLNLDENTTQMRLAEGSINFRVAELREGEVYEVDSPNIAFVVKQAGAFRIDVDENGDATRITVIRGAGEVSAGGRTYEVHEGERAEFDGTDTIQYSTSPAPAPDSFDQWAQSRDLKEDNSTSAQYVSRDVPGYSDLDDNGTWSETPDYGPVWYPTTVSVGWAPYSSGYWGWVGPWGWTWVDYNPWGFAPFHYGRWAYINSRWGWCPGPRYVRPFYGPAFVGFVGGAHFGVGFSFGVGGGVGWFPLGPREPFYPWWHGSRTYITNINAHNTNIRNVGFINGGHNGFNYRYARNVNAVTVTSRANFTGGQSINRGTFRVTEASLRGAQVSNRTGFTPTRQSFEGAAGFRGGRVVTPSAAVQSRTVVARNTPARGANLPVRSVNSARNLRPGGSISQTRGFGNRPNFGANANAGASGNARFSERAPGGQVNSSAGRASRQRELAGDKPQFAGRQNNGGNSGNSRTWAAQGNSTDRGRAPAGVNRSNNLAHSTRMNVTDRPPWARDGNSANGAARGSSPNLANRSDAVSGRGRSFDPPQRGNASNRGLSNGGSPQFRDRSSELSNRASMPQRSYNPPQRSYPSQRGGYSAPSPQRSYPASPRSYSSAPQRSYSPAPQRSYSPAPQRTYSAPAPSRSYSAPRSAPSGGGYRGGGSSPRSGGSAHVSSGGGSRGRH